MCRSDSFHLYLFYVFISLNFFLLVEVLLFCFSSRPLKWSYLSFPLQSQSPHQARSAPLAYHWVYVYWEGLCQVLKQGDMANNSFRGSKHGRRGEANHETEFSCSLQELRSLMELRGAEAITKIQDCYGDINGLCARLRTSPIEGNWVQVLFFCVCLHRLSL